MKQSHSTPINKAAAIAISKGTHFNHELKDAAKDLYWINPKPMIEFDQPLPDLTGVKFGRLTVLGFLGGKSWQVRCSCGLYSSRRRKAILNKDNNVDACTECANIAYIKRTYHYLKTGKNKETIEFM